MIKLIRMLLLVTLVAVTGVVQSAEFKEGVDYKVIPAEVATAVAKKHVATSDKIEVIEFFSYACPHCNAIAKQLHDWSLANKDNIDFNKIPVSFFKGWDVLGQGYYTAMHLGVLDQLDMPIFNAIHKENKDLKDKDKLRQLFIDQGVSAPEFDRMYTSFGVARELKDGQILLKQYQVYSVPTIIIDNRYMTTLAMAKTPDNLISILDYLLAKSKK